MSIPASLFFAFIWLLNVLSFEHDGHHKMAALGFLIFMFFGLLAFREALKLAERRKRYLYVGIWGLKG